MQKLITFIIPAKNEELSIRQTINHCYAALAKIKLSGEIIVIDSSTDNTAKLAQQLKAKVIPSNAPGIGNAYLSALPHIQTPYTILLDADFTYDLDSLGPFLEKLLNGYDLVIGSRIRGKIDTGAMPTLHRYFGNPLTTFIFNLAFHTKFTDIHCGLRGFRTSSFRELGMTSSSWDYAVEMLIRSLKCKQKIIELPINYHKSPAGRKSHLCAHWYTPWYAGVLTLRRIFINL